MKRLFYALFVFVGLWSCDNPAPQPGVSLELAKERRAIIDSLKYALHFNIPEETYGSIKASETLSFRLNAKTDVFLDVLGFEVLSVIVNGHITTTEIVNEHLVLPKRYVKIGDNEVRIEFVAGEQSLNRREEYLYTLLVPDRARTLFPCFDQPDLKARYTLSLSVPEGWIVVSNTDIDNRSGNNVKFNETEPLSTYLFSFVAGKFECVTQEEMEVSAKPIHLYHRETDRNRISQCPEILRQVKASIDWLQEYTDIDYPFAKYDLIILPDFQYGGMEHTGATLYNDKRIFLDSSPTTDEILGRSSLIAHETAHMWFGDYVTMKWFDDVWTKEVFANFFASKMVMPLFPDVNHHLNDLKNYYAAAYEEDRTIGANAIQRPLDNLKYAGLIYCNTIYDKAPVVMANMERRIGPDAFRAGIRKYLDLYAYGNATWDDLVSIFDSKASFDVGQWSRAWVKERGMPRYSCFSEGNKVTVRMTDPFDAGTIWQQGIVYTLVSASGESVNETAVFDGVTEVILEAPFEVAHIIPNSDGMGYGWFLISPSEAQWLQAFFPDMTDENARMAILMTLYENTWHRLLPPEEFVRWVCKMIPFESNALIRSSMMGYAASADKWAGRSLEFEEFLHRTAQNKYANEELRIQAFRHLINVSSKYNEAMMEIWRDQKPFEGMSLSERDYTAMSCQLMIRYPSLASEILAAQAGRISNPDRKDAFLYVSQACSADSAKRNRFFESLLDASTRGPESRTVEALALLTSPLRGKESVFRIKPSLEAIEDIQRTGDIFFPTRWCASFLGNHTSYEAAEVVQSYIESHPNLNPLLKTKILQKGGWLLEEAAISEKK